MPSAAELPSFEVSNTETPSPLNPLGAKGIGESATIGSTPAVHNAVVDALSHLGDPPPRHAVHGRAGVARDPGRRARHEPMAIRDTDAAAHRVAVPRRSSAHCYDGLPDEACGLLVGPVGDGRRADGRRSPRRARAANADASARHLHRRLARPAARAVRDAEARGEELVGVLAQPHPHRRVPVADRRAAGRVVSELDLRDREPARRRARAAGVPHPRRRRSPRSRWCSTGVDGALDAGSADRRGLRTISRRPSPRPTPEPVRPARRRRRSSERRRDPPSRPTRHGPNIVHGTGSCPRSSPASCSRPRCSRSSRRTPKQHRARRGSVFDFRHDARRRSCSSRCSSAWSPR